MLRTRKEIPVSDTWDLSSLCKGKEDWQKGFDALLPRLETAASFAGTLGESNDRLYEALSFVKTTDMEIERIYCYASLCYESDGIDDDNQQMAAKSANLIARFSQALSYMDAEIQAIGRDKLDVWMKEERFAEYRVYLTKLLRYTDHILSKTEEHLLSLSQEALNTPSDAYHDLTDVDFTYPPVDGKSLTPSTYALFMKDEDEKIRREAYLNFYQTYENHEHVIAKLYQGSVNGDIFIARARHYTSSLDAALFPDNVPEEVYKNLISTIHEGFPALHRYYALLAKVLGKQTLKHYDVYMPLTPGRGTHHSYDEAVALIDEAVSPLGKEYQQILHAGLTDERWVDRYENKGKRSGAFSSGTYTAKPYILTNFNEELLNSVFTLIHEGGHSMHSYYSARNNPYMSYNYTIFEAEVASTFNEQLLAHHLIASSKDKKEKAFLIGQQLSDIVATLFRQTMFAEFELLVHESVEKGQMATVDMLRRTYRGLLEAYFGPQVEFEPCSDLEGLRIPHFYRAFYVYKYATGVSAAIALSHRVLTGGEKERTDYLSFLKSGGSTYPIESLKKAGVDMSSPEPIRAAIAHFEALLTEAEALI